MKRVIILLFLTTPALAQWPGYFYAFELTDKNENPIDSMNKDYKMTTVKSDSSTDIMLAIEICEDNKTWRFYEGGFHGLDNIQRLKIEKMSDGNVVETMTIKFPSSLSGGKEKSYRNLYAGKIKFKKGTYTIRLPESGDEWDELKELKLCPVSYMNYSFDDISKFQK